MIFKNSEIKKRKEVRPPLGFEPALPVVLGYGTPAQ